MKKTFKSHLQITEAFRKDITSGAIPADTRLPAMEVMAKEWNTSYFTIWKALAPLVKEGLLESRGKLGTVVIGARPALACAGIYYGMDIWSVPEAAFYRAIHVELKKRLGESGVELEAFVDDRPERELAYPREDLIKAIEERRIQSLIIPIANQSEIDWLKQLPIAKSYIGTDNVPWRVLNNAREELRYALQQLKEQGVRGVGLIGNVPLHHFSQHPFTMLYTDFVDIVAELGMYTRNQWCHVPDHLLEPRELEEYGYHAFTKIWGKRNEEHPEGLISICDVAGRGVFTAILHKRVSVPKKLKLVQFKNKSIGFFSPLEATWIITDESKYAEALIRLIREQMSGNAVQEILIDFDKAEKLPKAAPRRSQQGMTLMELLVVIAIIATLAVLLFASSGRFIATAQKATCMANMRTYHTAIMSYVGENNQQVPPVFDYGDPSHPNINSLAIWANILVAGHYLPEASPGAPFVSRKLLCPANKNGYMPGEGASGPDLFKYGYPNYLYPDRAGSSVPGMAGGRGVLKITRITSRSAKAMLFEGGAMKGWDPYRCNYTIEANPNQFKAASGEYRIGDVHAGSSNVLFWDGHVETFSRNTINYRLADWTDD